MAIARAHGRRMRDGVMLQRPRLCGRFGCPCLRTFPEHYRRPGPALIRLDWCTWLLAVLIALAPLIAEPCSGGQCGGSGEPSLYARDTAATLSRPEAELRVRSLKRAADLAPTGGTDAAHLAVFLPEPPYTRLPQSYPTNLERRSRAAPVSRARSPPPDEVKTA